MLKGKNLQDLALELKRQETTKRDFLVDTRTLEAVNPSHDFVGMRVGDKGVFPIRETAHKQISKKLKIRKEYYDRMLEEAPGLLVTNINHWLNNQPRKRMVRTLDGQMRSFLGSTYRPLDNLDLAEAALPVLVDTGAAVRSAELTDSYMYIQAVLPKLQAEVKKGDVVQAGIVISNSEIGKGAVKVEPFFLRMLCLNGMVSQHALRKYHLGRNWSDEEEDDDSPSAELFFTERTKELSNTAFWNQVKDVVKGSFNADLFNKSMDQFREAADEKITSDPIEVVEIVQKKFGLSEAERGSVLNALISGQDLSRWGLANAVTAAAHKATDYDRSVDLERFGGQLIELPKKDWSTISKN